MYKTEERLIDGVKYRISQLGVDAGLDVGVLVLRSIGPAMLSLLEGGGSLAKIDRAALGDAIARLSAADLKTLCHTFAEKTFVVLGPQKMPRLDNVWDTHFAGKYRSLLGWLGACVQMNFPDFLGSSAGGTTPPVASDEPAPTPST